MLIPRSISIDVSYKYIGTYILTSGRCTLFYISFQGSWVFFLFVCNIFTMYAEFCSVTFTLQFFLFFYISYTLLIIKSFGGYRCNNISIRRYNRIPRIFGTFLLSARSKEFIDFIMRSLGPRTHFSYSKQCSDHPKPGAFSCCEFRPIGALSR